jgi:hypothetical protein
LRILKIYWVLNPSGFVSFLPPLISRAESFLLDLERSGLTAHPVARTITYASGSDESAIDYWLGSSAVHFVDVDVGGSLVAQHRPIQAVFDATMIHGLCYIT